MRFLSVAIATIVAAAALAAGAAHAAAPRIVIFSGKPIGHQVVISDWQAIFRVFDQTVPAQYPRARASPRVPSLPAVLA